MRLVDVGHFDGIFRQGQCGSLTDILSKTGDIFIMLMLMSSSSVSQRTPGTPCLGSKQNHLGQLTGAAGSTSKIFSTAETQELTLNWDLRPFSVDHSTELFGLP